MDSRSQLVLDFLRMWDTPNGWRRATEAYFSQDSVYENIGMSKSEGLEAILEFITHYENVTGGGWMVADTRSIAISGDVVLTERIDHMVDGAGQVFMTTPVMGAFEVRDGKIVAWRDYFDTGGVEPIYDGPGSVMAHDGR